VRNDVDLATRCRVRELLLQEIITTRARLEGDGDGPPLTDGERDEAIAWERALLAEAERLRYRDRHAVPRSRDPLRTVTTTALGRRWGIRRVRV